MGLLGAQKPTAPESWETRFSLAVELSRMGCHSEAFRILTGLEAEQETPALLCNLALCHMRAEQWDRALDYLDRSLSLHKKNGPLYPDVQSQTLRLLEAEEADSDGYRAFLPSAAPEYAPTHTKNTILRLLVDCCAELGLRDRVYTLAEALKPQGYQNVEAALERMDGEED
ncbi:MAG: tetratricopeptide repeat protein [Clostridiales bacterium]|nr:tetratricopeptide repeat protein [Clostridiales bacterium]